ncbi:hypothetical protein J437_LFUL019266 [Ladona fulva]|uniref:DNA-directed DNA polymerase n=1 Tax=Ladona fulva TaxID=123851 RepID=A0A8K0KR88_LADFU|nr:hypothetical protein J437_LFUL019266 [Ladona fulva]
MSMRYESTMSRRNAFLDNGYLLVEMWGCEFAAYLKVNSETRDYLENHPIAANKPQDPRDGFYGGRTNATKLYHRAKEDGEEIKYIDICSLYPFVNKWKKYPISHPTIYIGSDCPTLSECEGLIKCAVLPPSDLYHPVLPYRCGGKLTFPQCRTCAAECIQMSCPHNNEEREITGTWVSDELKKAVEKGYKVIKMYEVWQYNCTLYDGEKDEGGLFGGYINNFLKIKMEASGWPSGSMTECNA